MGISFVLSKSERTIPKLDWSVIHSVGMKARWNLNQYWYRKLTQIHRQKWPFLEGEGGIFTELRSTWFQMGMVDGDRQMECAPSTMEVWGSYDRFERRFSESMQKSHLYPSTHTTPPPSHASSISAGGPCWSCLIPSLQVNVQKDQLDMSSPPLANYRPTPRCFMSETWSWSNNCLCSI